MASWLSGKGLILSLQTGDRTVSWALMFICHHVIMKSVRLQIMSKIKRATNMIVLSFDLLKKRVE